jgi:hypothetical protein
MDFYIKRKEGERARHQRDRERECVCVREAEHCGYRKIEPAIK